MADQEPKDTKGEPSEGKADEAANPDSKRAKKEPMAGFLKTYYQKLQVVLPSSIASNAKLGFAARVLLTIVAILIGAFAFLWIIDKFVYFYLAKTYVDEIADAYNLNKHLTTALVLITFVAAAFFGRYLWSFSKQKRLIGVVGLVGLLIGHSLAMWGATRSQTITGQGVSLKCYVITRDGHVIYRERPGIDPGTGRECRPVKPELVERLSEYEKGKRPQQITSSNPTFFDPRSGEPVVWYYRSKDNQIELFDLMGFHPITGDELLQVNKDVVQDWYAQLKQQMRCTPKHVDPATFVFFDPRTGEARGWYWKDANNNYDFFDCAGFDPASGEALLPVTRDIIAAWKTASCHDSAPQQINPDSYPFFDPVTGAARVWYWRSDKGVLEFYNACGFDPRTGDKLQIVTREIVDQWTGEKTQGAAAQQLPAQAVNFVATLYYVLNTRPNNDVINVLSAIYADQVTYFGKLQSRDAILNDQQAYFERWPSRRFIPRQDTVQVSCDPKALSCVVRGVLDYDHNSPDRNAHAWGVATFNYVLNFASLGSTPTIVEEGGETTERHLEPLSSFSTGQSPSPPQQPIYLGRNQEIINNVLGSILSRIR
jgi:hypothetical protein